MERLVDILGCKISASPLKCLGPLGAFSKGRAIWDDVLERMEKRLESWKKRYLSKCGRLTLIKSTLSSLPTYFMSLTLFSHSLLVLQIEWVKFSGISIGDGWGDEFKFNLTNWDYVCFPIQLGGLGWRWI